MDDSKKLMPGHSWAKNEKELFKDKILLGLQKLSLLQI